MLGPVLYCLESPDLPAGADVPSVYVPANARLTPVAGLAGVAAPLARTTVVLRSRLLHRPNPTGGDLYRPTPATAFQPINAQLIPYFAWANRGPSAMSVWLPVVWPAPASD